MKIIQDRLLDEKVEAKLIWELIYKVVDIIFKCRQKTDFILWLMCRIYTSLYCGHIHFILWLMCGLIDCLMISHIKWVILFDFNLKLERKRWKYSLWRKFIDIFIFKWFNGYNPYHVIHSINKEIAWILYVNRFLV